MNPNTELEILKCEAEIGRVDSARLDMLLKIREREIDIDRIRQGVRAQEGRIVEVRAIIEKLKQEN